nr:outer membrane beta-barrel protein [uncultured Allomuricauda sp.]
MNNIRKQSMIVSFVVFVGIGLLGLHAQGQDPSPEKGSFGVSTNPAYFALGGYSVRGIYHLPKRWSFGLNVEAGFELPDDFRDLFFNDNQAINVDWDYLVAAEARYRFSIESYDAGFYVNGSLGYEGWTVNETISDADTSFDNWFSSLGVGYTWYPFKKKNFNVGINYNIIFILNNTEDQQAGNTTFAINRVIPPSFIPSNILIGWRF